jgi:AcrR family transcriptional regulator
MSPPSLYARVDGLAGLFAAVYDRGMAQVAATEQQVFAGLPRPGATTRQRAFDAVAAITEVFARHASFLRPIIGFAGREPTLLRRGAAESRRLLDHIVRALQIDTDTAEDIARNLYSECVVRTMYGDDFFTDRPESTADFQARISRMAASRASD